MPASKLSIAGSDESLLTAERELADRRAVAERAQRAAAEQLRLLRARRARQRDRNYSNGKEKEAATKQLG